MGLPSNEPIAIVGMGCRFPGGASSPSKLWDLLREPRNTSKSIPTERFNVERFYHPDGSHHGTCNVTESYLLDEDIRQFDAGFFGVPPGEAAAMDPQHRLLMETVYEAMESAGQTIPSLQGSDTAVYVGVMCSDYYILHAQDFNHVPTYNSTGIANSNASARLSYFFDWHGPCMTIDTACSSSLVAVHQAVQALRAGTSKIAVAAGTNLLLSPLGYISESKLSMLSPSGRCQMWDENADGYARGEGVAALIMKPLSTALADGDHVECIIRETGVNQDGKTKGITMPSAASQAALIRDTYERAGLDLNNPKFRCQYFEAHGTGTPAGDPQEAEALDSAFFSATVDSADKLYVGSVKTVIGHTEGTAGLAGIIKAFLAIKHGIIPPNLLFNLLSSAVAPFYNHLEVVTSPKSWPKLAPGVPRRASVNSFGFGGTNAHAILEGFGTLNQKKSRPVLEAEQDGQCRSILPFNFSAASEKSLRGLLEAYVGFLSDSPTTNLRSLAYSLSCRRSPFAYKTSFSASSQQDLVAKLEASLSNSSGSIGTRSTVKTPSILGVFTGQGAQWPQMGTDLVRAVPCARSMVQELDNILASLPVEDRPEWTILSELEKDSGSSRLSEARVAQPVVAAVQILLVRLLQLAGVKFRAVIGHSSGEISAAYAAGLIDHNDAIRIAYYRGFHSKLAEGPTGQCGAMLAVGTSLEDAKELCSLDDFSGRVVVAASNSSTSVTLSGDADAIDEMRALLEEEGKFVRPLRVDKAYHSHHMKPATEPFLQSLKACDIQVLTPPPGSPTWFSSVHHGTVVNGQAALDGQYWVENLNGTVLFSQALETALVQSEPFNAALEVGPHPALRGPATEVMQAVSGQTVSYSGTLSRGKDDVESFSDALGSLWINSGPSAVDFEAFQNAIYEDTERITLLRELPAYPWTHDRALWSESRYTKLLRQQEGQFHDILGTRVPDGTEEEWRWRNVLSAKEIPWLTDHGLQGQTVFPATGYISLALEAGRQIAKQNPIQLLELTDLSIRKGIAIDTVHGTETLVTMTRIKQSSSEISALFACFSTISRDAAQLGLNAIGKIRLQLGSPTPNLLAPRMPPKHGLAPVDPDHFFSEVNKLGYNYGPTFRGIKKLARKMGYSTGTIQGPRTDETGTELLFHPGMLDAALQGMLCGFSSPGDGRLWSLHAPSTIRRVTLLPSLCGNNMTPEVYFDCAVTDIAKTQVTGDVEVFQSDTCYKSISVEGVSFIPFSAATSLDDKNLFACNKWDVDGPNGELALGGRRATKEEIHKAVDNERVAYYYLRTLRETVMPAERQQLQIPSHHEALFDYADYIWDQVQRGEHKYVQPAWEGDTYQDICAIMDQYDRNDPDFVLTKASGEALPAVVRGQTTILEHMTKNDRLDNYYKNALGFVELNRMMANVVAQISHRWPHLNILEIGAGTGGATKGVIAKLGNSYSSYTYTDISSGFFPKAQENFSSQKERFIYKTLDITGDPTEQGFAENAHDLVLAANVLHATPDLVETLRNVRRLLRPGGYLVMMEFTDMSPMRMGLIIGGLPGWWVGRDSGRRYTPAVTLNEWDRILTQAGFAGVETSTPVLDPVVMPACIIAAQAIEPEMSLIRQPCAAEGTEMPTHSATLLMIGGETPATASAVQQLTRQLEPYFKRIVHAGAWETLDSVPESCCVLNLSECDSPFWKDITAERFEKLKEVLLAASTLLWVSHGSDASNPDSAMTYGFFRCLYYELPETLIQILDLEGPGDVDVSMLTERLMRLEVTSGLKKRGSLESKLWTTEPEVRLRNGRFLIPRLHPDMPRNARYNSAKREILKEVDTLQSRVSLAWQGAKYALLEEDAPTLPSLADHRRVQVQASLLPSLVTPVGRLFFSLGADLDTKEHVLSASAKVASEMSVHKKWSVSVQVGRSIDVQYLSFLSGYLMSQHVASLMPSGATLVVFEPDQGLASLIARQVSDMGCKALFITTVEGPPKRGWTYMHPRTADREIRAALPKSPSVYLDLSAAGSLQKDSAELGARIASMLPTLCNKLDASLLVARETTEPSKGAEATAAIQDILERANAFASAQLNGVPDGMPLRAVPVRQLVSGDDDEAAEMMSIVSWTGETTVPVRVEPITERQDLFVGNKTYWLVGLAGDLGRSICDFMVEHGARHVVLTSRNPQVDTVWVENHGRQGAKISYLKGDISVHSDVRRVHAQIVDTLPPIAGVANGALVLRDRGLVNMDLETFHANTLCKVEGTTYLNELFGPGSNLDWFIAFSSISATVGNMGQMAYGAANSFMKALVSDRRQRGLAGTTIDISQVFGVGYIEREMKAATQMSREQASRLMNRSGTIIMSEPDLHQLFAEAVVSGRPGSGEDPELITGIKTITPDEATEALWGTNVRFGHFIQTHGTAALPSVTRAAAVPVKVQLEKAEDEEQMMNILKGAFVAKLKSSMMAGEDAISETTPLIDLGVDSLVAVEIRTWFAQEVGLDVAVLRILGGPSIQELLEEAVQKLAATLDNGESKTGSSSAEGNSTSGDEEARASSQSSETSIADEVTVKGSGIVSG